MSCNMAHELCDFNNVFKFETGITSQKLNKDTFLEEKKMLGITKKVNYEESSVNCDYFIVCLF